MNCLSSLFVKFPNSSARRILIYNVSISRLALFMNSLMSCSLSICSCVGVLSRSTSDRRVSLKDSTIFLSSTTSSVRLVYTSWCLSNSFALSRIKDLRCFSHLSGFRAIVRRILPVAFLIVGSTSDLSLEVWLDTGLYSSGYPSEVGASVSLRGE